MDLRKLLPEEKTNLLLVSIRELEIELPTASRGRIEMAHVEGYIELPLSEIADITARLRTDGLLSIESDASIGKTYVSTTDKAYSSFRQFDELPLNELSTLLLQKSYDLYRRYGFDMRLQMNSSLVGSFLGVVNKTKLISAVRNLIDKGLLAELSIMRDFIFYTMTERGVNLVENSDKSANPAFQSIVIQGSNQNVSINSQNTSQRINVNAVDALFKELEQLIRSRLPATDITEPLSDLETIKELAKSKAPKIPLIQRIVNNFDKIPILIEVASKLRDFISTLPH